MKSFSSIAFLSAAATVFVAVSNAGTPSEGCFSSTYGLTIVNSTDPFTSTGSCGGDCTAENQGYTVFALANQTYCFCGTKLPPSDTQVANSSCSASCPGYPDDKCGGGTKYASVYLINDNLLGTVSNIDPPTGTSQSSASGTASTTQSVVTVIGGQTVYVTPSASATGKAGGASKAGIAAGVVVGLIAIAAIAGGIFLFIRNKQRREVEEEYRRNAAISSFTQGGKHPGPGSSGGASTFSDMRLDPAVMAQRRLSDGSIADNQDYSRRILKVTNA